MDLVSINQASQLLGFSPHTVRKWVDAGLIPAKVYPNGRTKIKREDIDRFYANLPDRASREILADRKTGG